MTSSEIRMGRGVRGDLRVRLGDAVTVRAEPNVKYATNVKVRITTWARSRRFYFLKIRKYFN